MSSRIYGMRYHASWFNVQTWRVQPNQKLVQEVLVQQQDDLVAAMSPGRGYFRREKLTPNHQATCSLQTLPTISPFDLHHDQSDIDMSFLRLALRSVARPRLAVPAALPSTRSWILQNARYSAAAGLSKEQITTRVLDVLKGFEKVDQTKVRHLPTIKQYSLLNVVFDSSPPHLPLLRTLV